MTPLAGGGSPSNLLLVPSIVETARYSSELMLANWSSAGKRLQLQYVESQPGLVMSPVSVELELKAGEQRLIPDFLDFLRQIDEHRALPMVHEIGGQDQRRAIGEIIDLGIELDTRTFR